jgi:tetratricopeptide (TPR) repeat protein
MALAIQEKLAAEFPAAPEYRSGLAQSHINLGNLLAGRGKPMEPVEGEEHYRMALAIQEKLAAEFPTAPDYRKNLALIHNNLGLLLAGLGKPVEAEEQYRNGLAIRVKLAADFPAAPDYRSELAASHHNLGLLFGDLGQPVEAEGQDRKALAIEQKLADDFPAVPEYRRNLASSHNILAFVLADLGNRAEAQEQQRQALAIQEKLAAEFPDVPQYQIELGGSYCNYGNLFGGGGRAGESLGWFDKAIAALAPVHRAQPRDVNAKNALRNCHGSRAMTYDTLAKHAEAVLDWDRAVELSPPAEQLALRARRVYSHLLAGQVTEAVAEVAELTATVADPGGSPNWDANTWYNFACVYSIASVKIADKQQEYADRAMELLHKAVQAGWTDATHIAEDTDLDPLREREDFKKLLSSLDQPRPAPAAPAATPEPSPPAPKEDR